MNIIHSVSTLAKECGINYIIQTITIAPNGHFLFYAHTPAIDSDAVCIWKIKYKTQIK